MPIRNNQIDRLMDGVLDIIESIKTKLTDQEYIDLMDRLKEIHTIINAIPPVREQVIGGLVRMNDTSVRDLTWVNFCIGNETLGSLYIPEPDGDYPVDYSYKFSLYLDETLSIEKTNEGWSIDVVDDTYTKSTQRIDGWTIHSIHNRDEQRHTILGLPSESWIRSDGTLAIDKWHLNDELQREREPHDPD